jgi:hypothetical protein
MPTKRNRRNRGSRVSEDIVLTLGLGGGVCVMPPEELRALWLEYGARVTEIWGARHNEEPFVARIARDEGWDDADEA